MKFNFSFSTFVLLLFCGYFVHTGCAQQGQNSPVHKTRIMILGVNHFVSQNDYRNSQKIDASQAKQQKEIKEVVKHLQKFQPTKIAVEAPFGDVKINARYEQYLAGKYTLTANEIDQLGFQLAKNLNQSKLYPVDFPMGLDIGEVIEYAKANGQESIINQIENNLALLERMKHIFQTATLLEQLRRANSVETQNLNHGLYIESLKIGKDSSYIGAEMTSEWYRRNLKIFANLTRIADASGKDKILLIIGVGHCKILRRLVQDSADFELVEVDKYLKK